MDMGLTWYSIYLPQKIFMNRSTVQPIPWKFLFFLNGFVLAIKRPEIRRSSVMVHKILPSFPVENGGKRPKMGGTVEGGVAGFRPLTRRSSTVHTEATRISLAETT